jgi:hypothetical protein
MRSRSAHAVATEALRLRAWALPILLADGAPCPPPEVSRQAWELFAEMEWVSQPLRATLDRAGVWTSCDETARRTLAAAAGREVLRIHAARVDMERIGALAVERGWKLVVLKGGAAVAQGADLHLADVDFLAAADAVSALASVIEAERGEGISSAREERFDARAHHEIGLEVHRSVSSLGPTADVLAGAVPMDEIRGLWRLPAREQLWHVLFHAVVRHADRVARLRDLLLLRMTAGSCTASEIAAVEARAAAEPLGEVLLAMLHLALTGGGAARTESYVRGRYFLLARWRWLGTHPRARGDMRHLLSVSSLLLVPGRRRVLGHYLLAPTDLPCRSSALNWLCAHAPPVGRVLRVGGRSPMLCLAMLLATAADLEGRLGRSPA